MAVIGTDIKFYHSLAADGGDIDVTNEILSEVLNSFIPDVSASDSEAGYTKKTKFYVKNTHATDSSFVTSIALSSFSLGDDYFTLYPSTGNATIEGNETFTRRYGVARAIGELSGFDIPIEFEDPAMYADIFQAGDSLAFFDSTTKVRLGQATIAAVTSTLLTITEDLSALTLNGSYVGTIINKGTIAASAYTGFWLEQIVPAYSNEQLSNTMSLTFYFDPAA